MERQPLRQRQLFETVYFKQCHNHTETLNGVQDTFSSDGISYCTMYC